MSAEAGTPPEPGGEDPDAEPAPEPAPSVAQPVLETDNLCKWYGDVIGLNDVTVTIPGGITGLLGPNGSGKSTFMKMVVGLLKPSYGDLRVLGEDPWDNTPLRSRVGYLPEGDAPWRDLPGRKAATIAGRFGGLDREAAEDAAMDALERVGLADESEKRVEAYSRGMRQRFKFALTLMHEPELLVLDEPLAGADPLSRRDLIQLIRNMADEGRSVLVSTHILPDVEAMTQRILLLSQGRLMAHGEVGEIRDLLEQYPRTIRITTSDPEAVGAQLWPWDTVLSVEKEDGAVVVRTREPAAFYGEVQDLFLEGDVPFTSITSPDDNVEAIFHYLVGER